MPSILDAADAFSKLGRKSVLVHDPFCVRVRHRHASCDSCLQVCQHQAISIGSNSLEVDSSLCSGCGACSTVCPTEALQLLNQPIRTLFALIDQASSAPVTIMCDRARNQNKSGEPSGTFQGKDDGQEQQHEHEPFLISCLAALDESVLIHAACAGVPLVLASADCKDCPNANATLIDDVIDQARTVLAGVEEHRPIEDVLVIDRMRSTVMGTESDSDISHEYSRRDVFENLVSKTTDSIAEAAVSTLFVTSSHKEEPVSLAQSLMAEPGKLKSIEAERNAHILNDLFARYGEGESLVVSEFADDLIDTRLFGEIEIDEPNCDLCGICMKFCPTNALGGEAAMPLNHFVARTRTIEPKGELTFRANDCVACRLCVDICPRKALSIRRGITLRDLFALEPRTLKAR